MFLALWQYFLIFWHSSVDFSSFDKILPTAVSLITQNMSQLSAELIVNAVFQFIWQPWRSSDDSLDKHILDCDSVGLKNAPFHGRGVKNKLVGHK